MSSPASSQPSDPLVPAPAIELETVTARQVEEDTEASRAESDTRKIQLNFPWSDKKSNTEAKPTSRQNLELNIRNKNPQYFFYL